MKILARVIPLLVLGTSVALAGSPKASSTLRDSDGVQHTASKAFDGLLQTGWAEGTEGLGDGSWIELPLDRAVDVSSVSVWPGNLSQGARSLREYSRPRTLNVSLTLMDGTTVDKEVRIPDTRETGPKRVDIPIEGKAKKIRVMIGDSYEGGVFTDVFISEIAVNFKDGANPKIVERLRAWEETSSGRRAVDKNKTEIVKLFETINAAEFGDSESLQRIMDRAGDGAPYLRERVRRTVPAGYRVQALPPDAVAIKALLKLKDANAIPAIQMAALRVQKKEARNLQNKVEVFYADQELRGGGDRNVPYWGQEGWELGALRSFGEPMGIEVDSFGSIYVADLGNHRVQRFSPEGRQEKLWGGEPDISNVWFSGDRTYYVAGSAPGDKPGEFVNPVDVIVIPSKEGDGFAILDAKGRIQLYDPEGRNTIGWQIRSDLPISPGVGGEGYLAYSKGHIVAVWGDEAYSFLPNSEEVAQWTIKDGVPNAVESLKNGKLVMVFGRELIQYSSDGFRHGTVMNSDDLGTGLEDWDVSVDEKGKLWVVTDTGWAIKYKRPGKIDYKVKVSEYDYIRPRFAVMDDMLYILERDKINKVDALELHRKAELAEADAAAAEKEEAKSKK